MTNDLITRARAALDGVTPGPWTAEWAACRADREDIEYERVRKLKKGEVRRKLKVGDVLWRVPKSLGPLSVDHNHWTGSHIAASEEDAAFVCAARDLVPALVDEVEQANTILVAEANESLNRLFRAEAAEAKVEKLVEALRKIADCEEYNELDGSYAITEEAFIARAALAEIGGDQK